MTICPCSPSVLAPDVQRKRCRIPGNPSVGSRRDRRHPLLLRQQRPGGARCWPAATSFEGLVASASPAPRRFAHRTTDMAPMLCHADPCRASPCHRRPFSSLKRRFENICHADPRRASPCHPCYLLSALARIRANPEAGSASAVFGTISGPEPRPGGRIWRPCLNERRMLAVTDSYDAVRQRARTCQSGADLELKNRKMR